MPIIKSSIKQAQKSIERRDRRVPYKTHMKTMIRKVSDLAKAGKKDEAAKALSLAYKAIDMAAKKNIIHKKNAARKKSLLARMVATKKKLN
jgi:small subunit ribosomal protein S20